MTDNNSPKHPQLKVTRRDFLTAMSGALGGVALTMYGDGGPRTAYGALPNGYNFYRVWTANDGKIAPGTEGKVNPVFDMTAAVFMGTNPALAGIFYIYFHGQQTAASNPNQPDTLFFMNMDYSQTPPVPVFVDRLVAQGDSLSSSRVSGVPADQLPLVVGRIGTGDANSLGHYATTLSVQDTNPTVARKSAPGVYLFDPTVEVWDKVARFGDPAPDGSQYGGIFGDVAIDDNDNVTFVAATTASGGTQEGLQSSTATTQDAGSLMVMQKLMHVPQRQPDAARVLLRTGDLLPGARAVIHSFGLVDVAADGGFVAQVTAAPTQGDDLRPGTALIRGHVRLPADTYRLLAASRHLVHPRLRRTIAIGDTYLGPRIGPGHVVAHITHTTSHAHRLILNHRAYQQPNLLKRTGQRSSIRGDGRRQVAALGAPVIGTPTLTATGTSGTLTYTTEQLDDGSTVLTVSDGQTTQVLLKSGDLVQGKQITEILHGYHPRQADTAGRIAFAAEFLKNAAGDPTDSNNLETSIVVGIPL